MLNCVLLISCIVMPSVHADLPEILPAPGTAFLQEAETAATRARCLNEGEAGNVRTELLAAADALAAEPFAAPHSGGQWTHWYTCKEDGGALDAETPTRHVCRQCGAVYTGWPYDEVYVTRCHHHWLGGVETLGWAYTLEPKEAYAARVRAILIEYASFYGQLEQHDTKGNKSATGGRLFAQTLDESVDLCRIAVGYDRVYRAACFSEGDHERIAAGLIRPMVQTIQTNDRGISNWQTWHNAGVLCAGLILGDRELVDWAVNGKHGVMFQLHGGSITESGMWYEESPSYHWYALRALVYTMEAGVRAGVDFYGMPVVRKLFDAPLRQLFPDGTFPALHDSNREDIRSQRAYYAVAWTRLGDPRYAALARPCDTPMALFWGGAPVPAGVPDDLRLSTSNEESEGLAVLRDSTGDTAAFLDYGAGRSGHVQPAKLNLILFAHGDERLVDPGRLPYGNPLHAAWYRQTVAHNTVVVDGRSQRKCSGKLASFRTGSGYSLVHASADKAYPGVHMERVVVMHDDIILDLFRCRSDVSHIYDLPLHLRGRLGDLPECSPCTALGDRDGYPLLEGMGLLPDGFSEADLHTTEERRIHLKFLDSSVVFAGNGLGATPRERVPVLLRRQEGATAIFATVYAVLEPGGTPPDCSLEQAHGRLVFRAGDITLRVGTEAHVRIGGRKGA